MEEGTIRPAKSSPLKSRSRQKTPPSKPVAISSPLTDEEIMRGEAPMTETPPKKASKPPKPVRNGGSEKKLKKQESDSGLLPMSEVVDKDNTETTKF